MGNRAAAVLLSASFTALALAGAMHDARAQAGQFDGMERQGQTSPGGGLFPADSNRDTGWQGLPPIEPDLRRRAEDDRRRRPRPAETQDAPRPGSDAEAAGLRGGLALTEEERARRRALDRRAPWISADPSRPALGSRGLVPPASGAARAQLSGRPAATANRRTGRLPQRLAQPLGAEQPALGLRTLSRPTFAVVRARPAPEITISQADRRALFQPGARAVAVPVQPPRGADGPTIEEQRIQPSGRQLPNANPLGRNAVIDPQTGEVISFAPTVPPVNLRTTELVTIPAQTSAAQDAFAQVGLRAGSFIVLPSADLNVSYDTNPRRAPTQARGSWFTQPTLDVIAFSDWQRHEVAARIRGSFSNFATAPDANRPDLAATVTGRLDLTRDTRLFAEVRYVLGATSAGSPNLPALPVGVTARGLPLTHQFGATTAVEQDFGRLRLTARGLVDRFTFAEAPVSAGPPLDQSSRNYNAYALRLRAAYEISPALRPFLEVGVERRAFDTSVLNSGVRQGALLTTYRVGLTFELTRLVTGEVAVGTLDRRNVDPGLRGSTSPIVDGSLAWTATPLTTITATARSTSDETIVVGASSINRRDFGLQIDHSFRRWLVGTVRVGYGLDDYPGATRRDQRFLASIGLVYRATRDLQIRGEIRHEQLRSNQPGTDFTAQVLTLGLRLQR